jgi:MFS family permease
MYVSAVVSIAWMVKPLIGFAIDNFGLKRKTWIMIALLIDILMAGFLGVMTLPLSFLVTVLMLGSWNTAFRDVAVDGIMVCEGKEGNNCGKIQSVQWIAVTVAGVISTLIGAYLAEKYMPYQLGFLLLIPFYILGILAALKYSESKENTQKVSTIAALSKYRILFKDKRFLWVCLFIFLYKYSPSFGTPLWFIERDVFKWGRFFIGFLGALTSLVSVIGALIYFKYGEQLKVKTCLLISIWAGAGTALLYLYFTPITDIVYGIVFSVVGMFFHLLIMSVMARNCIKGLESTSFAFLCSVSNIAGTMSAVSGGWLLPRVGLQWLIILSAVTSLLCLPLISKTGVTNES